jgi:autotransporter-associated beta strand protein
MKSILTVLLVCLITSSSHAVLRTWVGGGGDNKWSTAANWSPAGSPVNGDRLSLSVSSTTTVDDIVGLRLDELIVGNDQTIQGTNVLVLQDDGDGIGITCGFGGGVNTVRVEIQLASDVTFDSLAGLLLIGKPLDLNDHVLHLRTDAAVSTSVINFGDFDGRIIGTGIVQVECRNGSPTQHGNVQFSGATGPNNLTGFSFIHVNEYTDLILKKTGGVSIDSRLEIGTNGTVKCAFNPQFAPSAEVVVYAGGQLLGGGEVHQMGTLEVHGNASVDSEGGTIVVRTNLIGDGTHGTPIIYGNLLLSNNVVITASGSATIDLDIPASIAGGSFSKIGVGTVVLRGTNTFTGTLSINDGAIDARSATAFGSTSGGTLLNDGVIILRGVAIGNEPLTCAGTEYRLDGLYGSLLFGYDNSSWAGTVTLNTNLIVFSGDTTTFSGLIQGGGGFDAAYDTVRLSGSAGNTFLGPTWAHGALLELNKSVNTPAVSSSLIIGGVGTSTSEVRWLNSYQLAVLGSVTLYTNGLASLNNFTDLAGPVTFTGGHINLGTSGSLNLNSPVVANATNATALIDGASSAGGLNLGSSTVFNVADGSTACDLQITARVTGTGGSIYKVGNGTLCASGNSTYTGSNTVAAGYFYVESDNALGSSSGGTTVSTGATLFYDIAANNVAEPLKLNGNGVAGTSGALDADGIVTNFSSVTLQSSSSIRTRAGALLYIPSVIDGTGDLTKLGTGTLNLSGVNANTYLGQTYIDEGILQLGKPTQVSIPSDLIIGNGQPSSPSATARYLAGCSNQVFGNIVVNENGLLDLNGQAESFSLLGAPLTLNSGGDVATGGGLMTLPCGSTVVVDPGVSGASSISGRLGLAANTPFCSDHIFAVGAAILPSGPELTISAALEAITSTARIIKNGSGQMRLSGNNTFTGQLVVNGGLVTIASSTAAGAPGGGVIVNSNAVLAIDGSLAIENEPLAINSTAPVQLQVASGASYWNSTVTLNQNTTLNTATSAASLDLYYGLGGTGTLTKTGPGTLSMLGSVGSTNTNSVTVASGTLFLNATASVNPINGPLIIGDGIGGPEADVVRLGRRRQIANTVPVTINSSGLLDSSGYDESFGALSGNGHLQLGPGPSAFEVNYPDATSSFDGLISGEGNFYKDGTGTLTLNGNNTYSGLTIVYAPTAPEGGTLLVNGSQPQSAVIISNGCTLGGSGTVGNITCASGATVSPGSGTGLLTCSGVTFNSGSKFRVELNGTTPGSGYDQLSIASGTVALNNATLNATLGFASAVSNAFTIINKPGGAAISGTFSGLAQNATFNISGIPFRISYTGGTGNSVVLTQLLPLPTLSLMQLSSSSLKFSWPTNYTGFTLESNTNLSSNLWTLVVPTPVISGTNYVVTNSTTTLPQCFYRLRSP